MKELKRTFDLLILLTENIQNRVRLKTVDIVTIVI